MHLAHGHVVLLSHCLDPISSPIVDHLRFVVDCKRVLTLDTGHKAALCLVSFAHFFLTLQPVELILYYTLAAIIMIVCKVT